MIAFIYIEKPMQASKTKLPGVDNVISEYIVCRENN